jgi:hypothetical protein
VRVLRRAEKGKETAITNNESSKGQQGKLDKFSRWVNRGERERERERERGGKGVR